MILRSIPSVTAKDGAAAHPRVPVGHDGERHMHISMRAAQAAALGTLLLGGCTVNNRPPEQVVIRQAPEPTTTIVTSPTSGAPATVYVQPR
jgi:hypothetical protein